MSPPSLSVRDWLRAGVISVALLGHGIYAIPNPANIDRQDLRSPEGAEEMERWRGLLGGVGIEVTSEGLEDFTLWWTGHANRLHRQVKAPFRPAFRLTRSNQAWALFASPDTHPHRLEVYVRIDGAWRTAFRRNDPNYDFLDRALRFRRVRGIYDGSSQKPGVPYWNFSRWVSREVLTRWPKGDRVRVQMVRTHTKLPWEEPDPVSEARVRREHTRTALFPTDGL